MKVGVNGAVRDISDLKVGANGAVRQASELWIGVNGAAKKVWPILPIGYQEIIDSVGINTWLCPATGTWNLELHGGGGAGGYGTAKEQFWPGDGGGGGGGSGEQTELELSAGVYYEITIGAGGKQTTEATTAGPGDFSYFKRSTSTLLSVSGGRGGVCGGNIGNGGIKSGSLATKGEDGKRAEFYPGTGGAGGYGNSSKPNQLYGNGGKGGDGSEVANKKIPGEDGQSGAAILTYLG